MKFGCMLAPLKVVLGGKRFSDMVDLKKILLIVVITGTAAAMIAWTVISFSFRSPMFAFLVNWLVMSWIALMGQVVDFPPFSPVYYEIKLFEQSGRLYERFGIRLFKKVVRRGPLTIFSPTLRFSTEKTAVALEHLAHEMRKAETSHAAIFLVILLPIGYALIRGWFDAAAWLLLFNILFNGYPVMLQRYNRMKLEELKTR